MKQYRVIEILTGTKLILNCGKEQGFKFGDKFLIYGLTKPLKDPDTGEDLGQAEIIRGRGTIIHLQEKLCTIESCLFDDGASRVIKRIQPFNVFAGGQTTEEEVTGRHQIKKFEDAQIGDYARLVQ